VYLKKIAPTLYLYFLIQIFLNLISFHALPVLGTGSDIASGRVVQLNARSYFQSASKVNFYA